MKCSTKMRNIHFSWHINLVITVGFSKDSEHNASGSRGNNFKLWNLKGKEKDTLSKHESDVSWVIFSEDSK